MGGVIGVGSRYPSLAAVHPASQGLGVFIVIILAAISMLSMAVIWYGGTPQCREGDSYVHPRLESLNEGE
jgi:hypothetical protein